MTFFSISDRLCADTEEIEINTRNSRKYFFIVLVEGPKYDKTVVNKKGTVMPGYGTLKSAIERLSHFLQSAGVDGGPMQQYVMQSP